MIHGYSSPNALKILSGNKFSTAWACSIDFQIVTTFVILLRANHTRKTRYKTNKQKTYTVLKFVATDFRGMIITDV
jgi:hypothetical protein